MTLASKLPRVDIRVAGAALAAIGVLHIIATLISPSLSPQNGYDAFVRGLPLNSMQVLPPITAQTQLVPFLGPDARYAACRFDATDGAVAINATLPAPGWVLALYSENGDNFFATVAAPGRARDVALLLTPAQAPEQTPQQAGRPPALSTDPVLRVQAERGLAIVRAPDQGEAYGVRSVAELKRARCAFRAVASSKPDRTQAHASSSR